MFFFWFAVTLVSVVLLLWRRSRGELRDDHQFKHLLSRETLFVLNNFIFLALFVAIFWGSFGAPIVSELFLNKNITLGLDYFMRVTPWLFAALYLLMGIAPLSAWTVTSAGRLGRALIVPSLLTVATVVFFMAQGMTKPVAVIGYALVSLAGWVAIYETFRGIMARVRTHGENPLRAFWMLMQRNPRRYGGYMIHLGITIIGIGVIGSTLFQTETQQTLSVGESLFIEGYELRYDQLRAGQIAADGRVLDIADVTVLRDGRELAHLRPRRDRFPENEGLDTMTIAGSHSTIENDFYVLLVGWEPVNTNSATFKVYINPLINLVWWGGLVLILGTLIASYPKEVLPVRSRQQAKIPAQVAKGAVSG
jgi:cytochrome c-type biogenesis protein CcmF